MNQHDQRLVAQLKPKQKTLELFADDQWQQLLLPNRRACSRAVAELISQVTLAKRNQSQTPQQNKHDNE